MTKRILWLENEIVYIKPLLFRLEHCGYDVQHASTVSEAMDKLTSESCDLLILDVMMPVSEAEEIWLPPLDTNLGNESGLAFYNRYGHSLEQMGVKILVLTIRDDRYIREKFQAAGLPKENFMSKSEAREPSALLALVEQLLVP